MGRLVVTGGNGYISGKTLVELDSCTLGSVMTNPSRAGARRSSNLRSGLWAVVPVKRFGSAKERLAAALSSKERARLAEAMLRDVLNALVATTELAGILVVTSDESAARLARELGAEVIDDISESGTNAAVARGLRVLTSRGQRGAIVVPGDIPLTTADELHEILSQARFCPIVLIAAARDGGTNLMLTQPPDLLKPCFGPDSFAKHVAAARAMGIEPCILQLDGIGLDIDSSDDLATLIAHRSSTCAGEFLEQLQIASEVVRARDEISSAVPTPRS
jgi:2-phospho-L-lactate/phosphoenolpyruvate guanylyltransferase